MRPILAAGLAATALATSSMDTPVQAASLFPWCAHYMMKGGGISCAFGTLEECLRTISGVGGSCQRNPYIEDAPPAARKVRNARPRRVQR